MNTKHASLCVLRYCKTWTRCIYSILPVVRTLSEHFNISIMPVYLFLKYPNTLE